MGGLPGHRRGGRKTATSHPAHSTLPSEPARPRTNPRARALKQTARDHQFRTREGSHPNSACKFCALGPSRDLRTTLHRRRARALRYMDLDRPPVAIGHIRWP